MHTFENQLWRVIEAQARATWSSPKKVDQHDLWAQELFPFHFNPGLSLFFMFIWNLGLKPPVILRAGNSKDKLFWSLIGDNLWKSLFSKCYNDDAK
jgi:hypothetical protein